MLDDESRDLALGKPPLQEHVQDRDRDTGKQPSEDRRRQCLEWIPQQVIHHRPVKPRATSVRHLVRTTGATARSLGWSRLAAATGRSSSVTVTTTRMKPIRRSSASSPSAKRLS